MTEIAKKTNAVSYPWVIFWKVAKDAYKGQRTNVLAATRNGSALKAKVFNNYTKNIY